MVIHNLQTKFRLLVDIVHTRDWKIGFTNVGGVLEDAAVDLQDYEKYLL